MRSLYSSPVRVYLALGFLAAVGVFSGLKLPISLFPNSAKPKVTIAVPYGSATAREFRETYGSDLYQSLKKIRAPGIKVAQASADYAASESVFAIEFEWGTDPQQAEREVELVIGSFSARLPTEIRESIGIWTNNENSGFFAASFFSNIRNLEELYQLLDPVISPELEKVADANEAVLWNPARKEVRLTLDPEKMASLGVFPRDIENAVDQSLASYAGGSLMVGLQSLPVQTFKQAKELEDLKTIPVLTQSGRMMALSEIAQIDLAPKSGNSRAIKTSGAPSLIVWAEPKPGGNVKRMSEDLIEIVHRVSSQLPPDVEYRVLVDPSEFIRSSVENVLKEVGIGAMLAVIILFLFIGSLRNTVTAAIEIPLSMVLAFILMRFSGMNLNLISLGGLALSAGMNVDASVVVMENIFRHFALAPKALSKAARLDLLVKAVMEVRFAVIASTIASLVVFLPLTFTSNLTYAILGDLAKTVVFSHGLSMIVALVLVPTVRFHLMQNQGVKDSHSPIEPWIRALERGYAKALKFFITRPRVIFASCFSLVLLLGMLAWGVLPRLPREVIGIPDTDWLVFSVRTQGNTLLKQMESQSDEIEAKLLNSLGESIAYTFTQVRGPNRSQIMSRLRDRSEMDIVWKKIESLFPNTPFYKFSVGPWNPAELPIPDPPQMKIVIPGDDSVERAYSAREIVRLLEQKEVFDRIWAEPSADRNENIVLKPIARDWVPVPMSLPSSAQLSDWARVATAGKRISSMNIDGKSMRVQMQLPTDYVQTIEDLEALPIPGDGFILPLGALARFSIEEVPPTLHIEGERDLVTIYGRQNEDRKSLAPQALEKAKILVNEWSNQSGIKPIFEDAEKELHDALKELGTAVALSGLLIFLTLVFQFGNIFDPLLVLLAIPLGFIGVLASLFIFKSTLSLNSLLGVILLNGIAVANSIILVDFIRRLIGEGLSPVDAAIEAARKRLRPILITSLTTILGMMPIALGLGEGGKILQPLGIAVSGGLWVSMLLTLFIVPALQVASYKFRKQPQSTALESAEDLSHVIPGLSGLSMSDQAKAGGDRVQS